MLKKCRQLHLWIGLFTSLLILVEAVTGLIMAEPGLIGAAHSPAGQRIHARNGNMDDSFKVSAPADGAGQKGGDFNDKNNIMGFIKNLHAGRIGNADISILLEISAVGLIILSATGIILSIKILRRKGPVS